MHETNGQYQKHRILMVSDFLYPNAGGVENHIYQLSQCLISRGHKVRAYFKAGCTISVRHLTDHLCLTGGSIDTQLWATMWSALSHKWTQSSQFLACTLCLCLNYCYRWLKLSLLEQVYYAPRQPVHCQVVLPTIFGGFRLLRNILIREGITLVHAHQAFSVMGHEAILQARTMGYKVSERCCFFAEQRCTERV